MFKMRTQGEVMKFLDKYLAPGENWEKLCERVAGIMQYEDERQIVKEALLHKQWLPNSPCLVNAGRPGGRNLMACHLIEVGNSIHEIFLANLYSAEIYKSGGGLGIELSELSPSGTQLKYAPTGIASGPVSFMKVFDTTAQVVMEGGLRRAAIMATLNANHPDIDKFIACKTEDGELSNFNISVTLDDGPHNIPQKLWKKIINQAHMNGEPGIVFLDNINSENPTLHDFGRIIGVNACSEVPLYDMGSCVLASLVLPNVISSLGDWNELTKSVEMMVRFLNRVIDVNPYPLPQIAQATRRDRRIGIGVMGWSDLLKREGIDFASQTANNLAKKICGTMLVAADNESWRLAKSEGGYLPNRRRNATLLAIAPTGHISRIAGVSPSIYPDYGIGLKMTPDQHLDAVAAWDWVDSAISYTVCYPHGNDESTVDNVFKGAHERGLKAISCYRDQSRANQPCSIEGDCS